MYTGKVEFGQDIRTSLTQVVAEELRAPLSSVRLVMGDTDRTPFDMGTFGSRTTPIMAMQLRKVAAAAREALLDLAAQDWNVPRETVTIAEGRVQRVRGGRSAPLGSLLAGRKLLRKAGDAPVDSPVGMDDRRPLHAQGQRPRAGHGRPPVHLGHEPARHVARQGAPAAHRRSDAASVEDVAARAAGATVVRDGAFVGIAAPSALAARRAAEDVQARWQPAAGQPSGAEVYAYLKQPPPVADRGRERPSRPPARFRRGRARPPRTSSSTPTPSPTSRTLRSSRAPRWRSGRTAS